MVLGVAELFFLALIIAGVVCIGLVMRRLVEMGEKPKRRLITDDQGDVVIIGEARRNEPVSFSRKGTYASDAMRLEAGVYKIEYQFPETSPVKVDLISATD